MGRNRARKKGRDSAAQRRSRLPRLDRPSGTGIREVAPASQDETVVGRGYTIHHQGLRDAQWQKIALSYFEAGHMMYIHQPSLTRIAGELRAFVGAA